MYLGTDIAYKNRDNQRSTESPFIHFPRKKQHTPLFFLIREIIDLVFHSCKKLNFVKSGYILFILYFFTSVIKILPKEFDFQFMIIYFVSKFTELNVHGNVQQCFILLLIFSNATNCSCTFSFFYVEINERMNLPISPCIVHWYTSTIKIKAVNQSSFNEHS